MKEKTQIDEAIELLHKKGIKVVRINAKQFRVWDIAGNVWDNHGDRFFNESKKWEVEQKEYFWTGREVIKLARGYMDSNQQTTLSKTVKKLSNRKNRTATRDAIKKEDFDNIPQNGVMIEEDRWGWD